MSKSDGSNYMIAGLTEFPGKAIRTQMFLMNHVLYCEAKPCRTCDLYYRSYVDPIAEECYTEGIISKKDLIISRVRSLLKR